MPNVTVTPIQTISVKVDSGKQTVVQSTSQFVGAQNQSLVNEIANIGIIANTASNTANSAVANVAYLQATNDTQNTSIIIIQGVDETQNNNIISVTNLAQAAFNQANIAGTSETANVIYLRGALNSANANIDYVFGVDNSQNSAITIIQGVDGGQNAEILIIQGVDTTQNAAITIIQGVNNTQNTNIATIQGVDLTQNASISAAYTLANTLQGGLNTANANIVVGQGVNNTQNTNISTIQGVDLTQNTVIAAAFDTANGKYSSTGGTISGSVLISQDLTVTGNVFLLGNITSINASSLFVNDSLIFVAGNNYATDILDIGLVAHYNDGTNAHTGIIRNAGTKEWMVFKNYTPEVLPNNIINLADPSFAYANMVAGYFKGNLIANTVSVNGLDLFTYSTAAFTQANTANILAQASFVKANTLQGGLDTANANIVIGQGVNNTQNANITVIQGVDVTQNASITIIQGVDTTQNTNIATIQGVDLTQNASISAAFALANTLQGGLNTANANIVIGQGVNLTQNTNIATIQGVDLTQNSSITAAFNLTNTTNILAQAAFDKANSANTLAQSAYDKANTGATSGYLANSVIFANTTGYLSNSSNLQFTTNASYANLTFASNGSIISTGRELVLGSTGDTYGSYVMRMQARDGQTGPLFQHFGFPEVIDFSFETTAGKRNLRYETRPGATVVGASGTEFQFGPATNPSFATNDSTVLVVTSGASISNTTGSFRVNGGAGIRGNVYSGGIYITGSSNGITFVDGTKQTTEAAPFAYTQAAFDTANTIRGGLDTANANIIIGQGVNNTQNADITIIQGVDLTQNTNISTIQGVDLTQNASITSAFLLANTLQGGLNTANANIVIGQGVNNTQNASITIIQGVDLTQNTNIATIQGVDLTQNASISAAYTLANTLQGGLNTANANIVIGQGVDTTQNTNISTIQGVDLTQNASITAAFALANTLQGGLNTANANIVIGQGVNNTQNANITIIQGVNLTQNTNISTIQGVDLTQNTVIAAAFDTANGKYSSTGGTISGSVTINQDLTVTGNVFFLGQTTSLNTSTLFINDSLIFVAGNNFTSDAVDIGIVAHYNDGTNAHTGIIRDASTKEWMVFKNYTPEVVANNVINIADPSFAYANMVAGYFKGNLVSNTISINGLDVYTYSTAAFDKANSANILAQTAFVKANTLQGGLDTANANIVIGQGVNNTQNANITIIQGVDSGQNASITIIQGVDNTQNTTITAIQGVDLTQNASISASFNLANTLQGGLNTANANIVINQGINLTQNAYIQAAFDKANTGVSGGSSSGYLPNAIIFANNAGYLSNSAALQFAAGSNTVTMQGPVNITNQTASTSNATGALIVSGGVGVANNIYTAARVGYSSGGVSVAYTYYNSANNSLDTIFG